MTFMRFLFISCLLVLASFVAAQDTAQEDNASQNEQKSFSFDFFATPWSAPLQQTQRLSVIADLNSTVQGMQDDPLKLGSILLQSITYNQTEVSSPAYTVTGVLAWRLLHALGIYLGSDTDLDTHCLHWLRLSVLG